MTGVVVSIRRIAYDYQGEVDLNGSPFELSFSDGTTQFFDAGGDGEALFVSAEPWIDGFAEPLSAENREWVRDYGKHVAVDVSAEEPYVQLIGHPVTGRENIVSSRGKVVGQVLAMGPCTVRILVGADELSVDIT